VQLQLAPVALGEGGERRPVAARRSAQRARVVVARRDRYAASE
jgi:hypothetical protein